LDGSLSTGGFAEGDQVSEVEIVFGSSFGDSIIGEAADETFDGGLGGISWM
jgi:hypothetical protein